MTRKTALPSNDEVRAAKAELLAHSHTSGSRPTVIGLALRVGLTNPTFWRHFPDIAREVADLGRTQPASAPAPGGAASRLLDLEKRNADLRRANQTLTQHLELAVANIQRLTLDNHQLRKELEAAAKVTRLDTRIAQRAHS